MCEIWRQKSGLSKSMSLKIIKFMSVFGKYFIHVDIWKIFHGSRELKNISCASGFEKYIMRVGIWKIFHVSRDLKNISCFSGFEKYFMSLGIWKIFHASRDLKNILSISGFEKYFMHIGTLKTFHQSRISTECTRSPGYTNVKISSLSRNWSALLASIVSRSFITLAKIAKTILQWLNWKPAGRRLQFFLNFVFHQVQYIFYNVLYYKTYFS